MNSLAKIGLYGLLAGGTASALYADPVGGWLSPNGVGGATTTTVTPGRDPTGVLMVLSLADLQVRVHTLHEQTHADARHIQHLQQIARREKDIIKLNCVNDKLVQVKPQMNLADAGEAELGVSSDANRMAVFDTISQAAEGVRRLREEADQCIGEPVTSSDSSNSFTAPQMPDDPSKGFGGGGIEPPSYASPFD